MLIGQIHDFSNLMIFGCVAYVHFKEDKLRKRALKCVFFGYPDGDKTSKILFFEDGNNKFIINKDISFNETFFLFISLKVTK